MQRSSRLLTPLQRCSACARWRCYSDRNDATEAETISLTDEYVMSITPPQAAESFGAWGKHCRHFASPAT